MWLLSLYLVTRKAVTAFVSFSGRTMLTTISVDYRDANKVHGFGENLAYTVECHAIQVSYKPFVLLLKISMTQDVLEHLTG